MDGENYYLDDKVVLKGYSLRVRALIMPSLIKTVALSQEQFDWRISHQGRLKIALCRGESRKKNG